METARALSGSCKASVPRSRTCATGCEAVAAPMQAASSCVVIRSREMHWRGLVRDSRTCLRRGSAQPPPAMVV